MSHPLKEIIEDPMEPNKPRPFASMAVGIEADLEGVGDEFRKAVVASCRQTLKAAKVWWNLHSPTSLVRSEISNAETLAAAILEHLGESP